MIKKIALFADSIVGRNVLGYLMSEFKADIAMVVILDDRRIESLCRNNDIPIIRYSSSAEMAEILQFDGIDLGVLAWWPNILPSSLLNIPINGFLNLHNSYLPYNRGKQPYFWALYEGNPFGVSIHRVDPGIDSGPVIARRKIEYSWEDTAGMIYEKSLIEIVDLFKEIYPEIRVSGIRYLDNDSNAGSFHYGHEIEQISEINLDQHYRARDLLNIIRGRTSDSDFPPAYFRDGEVVYGVKINIERQGKNR